MIIALGIPSVRDFLRERAAHYSGLTKPVLLYLPLAVMTMMPALKGAGDAWILVFYSALPLVLAYLWRSDWVVILAVWLPIEFDWIARVDDAAEPATAGLLALLLIYVVGYPNRNSSLAQGYSFRLSRVDIGLALKGLLIMLLIALPLGLYIGFVQWPPKGVELAQWGPKLVTLYLLALAEEVLFRGLIQYGVEMWLGRNALSLGLSAAVFGAAHLNNGVETLDWSHLNWEYAALATVAGVVYGLVWRWSGKVTVSALTHAAVNLVRAFL